MREVATECYTELGRCPATSMSSNMYICFTEANPNQELVVLSVEFEGEICYLHKSAERKPGFPMFPTDDERWSNLRWASARDNWKPGADAIAMTRSVAYRTPWLLPTCVDYFDYFYD